MAATPKGVRADHHNDICMAAVSSRASARLSNRGEKLLLLFSLLRKNQELSEMNLLTKDHEVLADCAFLNF